MDRVLGLSITSAAVRLVLVEGATGEGDTVDHDAIDIAAVHAAADADLLLETLLRNRVIAASRDGRPHSIGVTWTAGAAADGTRLLRTLAAAGFDDFLAVSEWDAAEALAAGIAGLAGCDCAGVCIVEPDAAVVAVVDERGTRVDRIDRGVHSRDAAELVSALVPMLGRPQAIFVFGSAGDLDVVLAMLRSAVSLPVVSAAEADLALAKGAALAAARALSGWEVQTPARAMPVAHPTEPESVARVGVSEVIASARGKVGALTSVLAAAVLAFVVSLSLALSLHLTDDPAAERDVANAAGEPAMAAKPPAAETTPAPTPFGAALSGPIAPPPDAAAPVPESEPVYDAPEAAPAPPPVYEPAEPVPAAPAPEPVYVPPAAEPAPVYVPPNTPPYQPPPQPRLRDRIIEKIPIINRFHDPQPYNP